MPKVGDKEFSYTDDGMRQAQIYANRTGQKIKYDENNRKFGYQEGGYTSDEYLHNTLNNRKPWITGDSKLGRMLGYPTEDTMDRAKELSQRKRTFIEKHGSLPESVDQPPSLLDESIQWKLIKQLAGPPQWIKNYGEADQMMTEGFERYGGMEDTWPAFVRGIKEAWGYQEGGEVNPEEFIRPSTPSQGTMNLVNDLMSGGFDTYNKGKASRRPIADLNYDDQVNIQDIVKMQGNKLNEYVDPSAGFQRRSMGFQEGGEAGEVKNKWDDKDPGDLQRKLYGRLAKFQEGGYSSKGHSPYEKEGLFIWDEMFKRKEARDEMQKKWEWMHKHDMNQPETNWDPNWDRSPHESPGVYAGDPQYWKHRRRKHKSPGRFGF